MSGGNSIKIKDLLFLGGNNVFNPKSAFGVNLKLLHIFQDDYIIRGTTTNVRGVIDSAVQTHTSKHISDFSTSVDGWAASRGIVTGNQDAVSDGVTSYNDVAKYYCNASSGGHFISQNFTAGGLVVGDIYRIRLRYLIPSGQTNVDGIAFGSFITDGTYAATGSVTGTWTYTPWAYQVLTDSDTLYITALKAGAFSFAGADDVNDDIMYLRDIEIQKHDGNSWVQVTTANNPQSVVASNKITTNGTDEFVALQDITAIRNDTQGTFYIKVTDIIGTGAVAIMFDSFENYFSSSYRFLIYFDGADKLTLNTKNVSNEAHVFPNAVTRGGTSIITIKSNGSTYEAYQDGTNLGTPTNNNGHWLSQCPGLIAAELGRRSGGTTFDAWEYRGAMAYVNRASTTVEDGFMRAWINEKG